MWRDEIKVLKVIFSRKDIQHIHQTETGPWESFFFLPAPIDIPPCIVPFTEPVGCFTAPFGMLLTLIFRRMDRGAMLMKQI